LKPFIVLLGLVAVAEPRDPAFPGEVASVSPLQDKEIKVKETEKKVWER
jgi:hypothetical protein